MVDARRARGASTRRTIVEGSGRVIDRVGFSAARLTQIAEEASVPVGSLYFHFKTKDEIAVAVIDEYHLRTRSHLAERIENDGHQIEDLILNAHSFLHLLANDAVVRAGLTLELDTTLTHPEIPSFYLEMISAMRRKTEQSISRGEIREDVEPLEFARFTMASFVGAQILSKTFSQLSELPQRGPELCKNLVARVCHEHERDRWFSYIEAVFADNKSTPTTY